LVGADKETVERYILLLEKAFVIFRLNALSRNMRKEIIRGKKIYFWDNGIRNSLIKNFNPINLRNDVGALWENFLISERLKANHYGGKYVNYYFWRSLAQQEVDYVEEMNGKMYAFEFKWKKENAKIPLMFTSLYPNNNTSFINKSNYVEFISSSEYNLS